MPPFSLSSLLDERLVQMGLLASSKESLLASLCQFATEKGYVKSSYYSAVLAREAAYPTGLPTAGVKVAIPHALEKEHIIKSGIFIATLAAPIAFKEMGNGQTDIAAEMVFLLAIKEPQHQLDTLQALMRRFAQPNVLLHLKNARTPKEIIAGLNGDGLR